MVTLAYAGVHEAYKMADVLAQKGQLEKFFCTLCLPDGRVGRWAAKTPLRKRLGPRNAAHCRRENISEWPAYFCELLLLDRFRWGGAFAWAEIYRRFANDVGGHLSDCQASTTVLAFETCALEIFGAAKRLNKRCVLSAPSCHPAVWGERLERYAEQFGITRRKGIDPEWLAERKRTELALSDRLLVLSEVQRQSFIAGGIAAEQIRLISPINQTLNIHPQVVHVPSKAGRLKVLFAGRLGVNKGLPLLLLAKKRGVVDFDLTLVGSRTEETEAIFAKFPGVGYKWLGPVSKQRLSAEYGCHDVLAMPSVMESFGLVAIEAVSHGLPVLCSDGVGVPFPQDVPRFNAFSVEAFEALLDKLSRDRHDLQALLAAEVAHIQHYNAAYFENTLLAALAA